MYDRMAAGEVEAIKRMPVVASLPIVVLKHLFQATVEHEITPQTIELGFDPEVFFEGIRGAPSDVKEKFQKPIKSEFSKPDKDSPAFISLIIDDNALNSLPLEVATIDRSFSVQEIIKMDPRLQTLRQYMTMDKLRDAGG